ncbi:dTMP kinase [uncultured Maricaulis sp.]|uniref:dTMP kinase n=1 Tax=uncultured Maricaulis sp. TaxID=174710 RepID=UPI0030DA2FAE|tara:strand:+ start:114543 stop:115178 length:636 start_codon:yes stop_codon:yes gene_type:complete
MRGRFITLEGGEGAGKTTLIKALTEKLRSSGLDVVVTREPGGTPGAEILREILLTGTTDRWSPMTEALLMYAARVDHVERLIAPALQRGTWVLSDRFADSTTAYQGAAGGVPIERIKLLHQAALGNFKPDLTLILDVNPQIGIERTIARGEDATRFERFDPGFHGRLRRAFLDLADDDPERCVVIDGSETAENVFRRAVDLIDTHLEAGLQ